MYLTSREHTRKPFLTGSGTVYWAYNSGNFKLRRLFSFVQISGTGKYIPYDFPHNDPVPSQSDINNPANMERDSNPVPPRSENRIEDFSRFLFEEQDSRPIVPYKPIPFLGHFII